MSSTMLYRMSGLALLLGAVLVIVGLPLSFVFTPDSPLALAMIGVWTGGVVLAQLGGPASWHARQSKLAGSASSGTSW
jgi:hypothetical protein